MAYTDKEKEKISKHNHYVANKKDYIFRKNERKRILTEWLYDYKSTHPCIECNESEPICIDFHHIDPEQKEVNVSALINCGSLKKLQAEIKKCVPLCANCHRKVHAGLLIL